MNHLSNYPHLNWYISNLRSIPGGSYRYGASPSQKQSGTRITMSPFRMGATPVTWGMWKEYCRAITMPGKDIELPDNGELGHLDDHPAVDLPWEDKYEPYGFCDWASSVAGFTLTIPTDVQWEYAARGGTDGLEYPWGNEFDENRLWCSINDAGDIGKTAPVDRSNRIHRNRFGLTDMVGNAWELCAHNVGEVYTDRQMCGGIKLSDSLCVRGGSWWYYTDSFFRCAQRFWINEGYWFMGIGIRLIT